jgi:cytidine deaminase
MQPSSRGPGSESGAAERALIEAARAASDAAYSPYSGVRVGAALRATDGRIFAGCNVENASYGLTICAERNAVAQAIAAGAREFERILIVSNRPAPLAPCGACRQVLREFGGALRVVCIGADGGRVEAELAELLPQAFGPADLGDAGPREP